MHEIRKDITTGNWVLIATDRAKRPQPLAKHHAEALVVHDPNCPFCPGNESETPPEVTAIRKQGRANDPTWTIRVIPNKYPALVSEPTCDISNAIALPGKGRHEVIIETEKHNLFFGDYDDDQIMQLWSLFQSRIRELKATPGIRSVVVFKNSGPKSGISLIHPHSQIVALPLVPPSLFHRLDILKDHHRQSGKCLICEMIEQETADGSRVVADQDGFVTLQPYAPRTPFETWVLPSNHISAFDCQSEASCHHFAKALHSAVNRLQKILGNLDFNLNLIDGGSAFDPEGHFHFFAKISPRVSAVAGFELGTGMFMNTHCPEEAAGKLRNAISEG